MQIVPARSIEKMGRPLGTAPSFECGGFPHVEDLLICSFQLRVPKLVCVVRSQCLDATGTLYSLRRIDRGLPQCRPIARHLKLPERASVFSWNSWNRRNAGKHIGCRMSKYPPAKPGALRVEPLKAAIGVAGAPPMCGPPEGGSWDPMRRFWSVSQLRLVSCPILG
jgi:hypothetical protein